MSWPLAFGTLIACGAGWLVARPLLAVSLGGLTARQRQLVQAGLLAGLSVLFFAIRLAPFGVVGFVLAGGLVAKAIRGQGDAPELDAPPRQGGMTRTEALSVLGLAPGADAAAIDAAHRRMIVRAHPDAGGSDYLAAKVNEARAVLRD